MRARHDDWDAYDEWCRYMEWLMDLIGFYFGEYEMLIETLHNTEFVDVDPRDGCRVDDGLMLRGDFLQERRLPPYIFDDIPCGILEMLVAFAIRIDREWVGTPGEDGAKDVFYRFLVNLKLKKYTDLRYNDAEVDEILEKFVAKNYDKNGRGCLFPRKNMTEFDRGSSLWSQMVAYVSDSY